MAYLDRFFEPDGWQEDSFTSTSGKKIRCGHAEPKGVKKGTVVITTGYADFMEAYHETMHEYLDRGYAVWMMDWAGHGGSEKLQPDANGKTKKGQTLDDHIEDLRKFRQEVVKADVDKPVILSTHSMGGQVALHYLNKFGGDFDGAILATPLVEMRVKGEAKAILRAAFQTSIENGLEEQTIRNGRRTMTRELTAERKGLKEQNPIRMNIHKTLMLLNDKLKAEDPTIGYVHSLISGTDRANDENFLKAIKTPVLLGIGLDDDVVDNNSIRRAGTLIPNARTVEIAEGSHGLWIERDKQRQEWWSHIDHFFAERHLAFAFKAAPKSPPPIMKGP